MNQATSEHQIPNQSPEQIVNISCYKFVALDDLTELQVAIRERARALDLRGTVLLSPEGINLFVAGPQQAVRDFVEFLRADARLADLQPKESLNDYQPFNRMLVKIKNEIIAFGIQSVDPIQRTSPKLSAQELRQWLDEGRPVHLLDVRNDYEYDIGTFDNAVKMELDHFREFPRAVDELPEQMKNQPVVMFCTGGIRCEKAGPYLEQAGFNQIYQLDGGILRYFEEVGGAHYHGECFVFDQRVAVDPALHETETTQCYVCQAVVTAADQLSSKYVPGKSCPACAIDDREAARRRLQQRQQQLTLAATPLPGSVPYLNCRPLNVPQKYDGFALLDFLSDWHPHVDRDEWRGRIGSQLIVPSQVNRRRKRRRNAAVERLPLSTDRIVRGGERFDHLQPGTQEPEICADVQFLYEDDELIVLHKPAPLPIHASGRFNRNTLRYLLNQVYYPERPHIVHRLDANTSGVLLLCRRKVIARTIQSRFENRQVQKTYVARVHGTPAEDNFSCELPISSEPGAGGIRLPSEDGDAALTHFRVLRRLVDGTTIVRATPVTGRTNQIRAHLWSLGYPIQGDPVWLTDGQIGTNRTVRLDEPAMCLHAMSIRFADHVGIERHFESPAPDWIPATNA
jgi:UPF0176 protein